MLYVLLDTQAGGAGGSRFVGVDVFTPCVDPLWRSFSSRPIFLHASSAMLCGSEMCVRIVPPRNIA